MRPKMIGNTFCTSSGLLINTAGGSVSTHDTSVTVKYCIRGKAYAVTAITGGTTPTTDANTGAAFPSMTASQGCVVVWGFNSAGTVVCAQGKIEPLDTVTGAFKTTPEFPAIPDTMCPFAYQVLKCDSTAGTVVFGTTNWDGTGFTNAIQNVFCLPNRRQIA